ncbi:MAG: type II secretion system protein, partial [Blastocatellia bacterium]|nr:type II secretion system protein [Blastocatellia bacterium]
MMRYASTTNTRSNRPGRAGGFTLIEVILAGGIMIILCVGTLTVFSHAVRINSGNNLRAQAQSVLQEEVEYYRSLR